MCWKFILLQINSTLARVWNKMGMEKQDENTNGLVWLQHERVYLQQSCIYFPICGHQNIFKKPRRLVTK